MFICLDYEKICLGHQILETIDEPSGQRLDRPVHCPRDIYQEHRREIALLIHRGV